MFVTSDRSTGDIGGLAGADAWCQRLADASDLTRGGVYRAWLSAGTEVLATRFTRVATTGPYVKLDPNGIEQVIAADWTELTSGTLRSAIDTMEDGVTVSAVPWTDTLANGTAGNPAQNCAGWTSASSACGTVGFTLVTTATWTENTTVPCNQLGRLFCFEQA